MEKWEKNRQLQLVMDTLYKVSNTAWDAKERLSLVEHIPCITEDKNLERGVKGIVDELTSVDEKIYKVLQSVKYNLQKNSAEVSNGSQES